MIDDDAVFRPQPVGGTVLASSSTPFAAFGFHRVDLRPRGSKPRMGPARVEVPPAAMPSRTVRPTPSAAASRASAGPARSTVRCPSQPTLWGHTSRVPGRGWRGAVPPLTPPTATAHRGRWTRRVGEDPRPRGGACRVAREGVLRRVDAVGSGAPVGRPGAPLDRGARRGRQDRRPPGRHRAGARGAGPRREPRSRCTLNSWPAAPARPGRRPITSSGRGTRRGNCARAWRSSRGIPIRSPRWPTRWHSIRSARAIEAQGFAVAPVRLVNRVAYARSLMVGQVAQEFRPNDKAAKEAAALHTFVCTHLYASRKETRTDGRKAKLRRGA